MPACTMSSSVPTATGRPALGAVALGVLRDGGVVVDEAVFARTVEVVIARLGHGPLVYRYRNDDGLPGHEGTFLLCAFWLVDALLWLGRDAEARLRFNALRALQNDVGLYAEEVAPPVAPTLFANATRAWETLPAELRARLEETYCRTLGVELAHLHDRDLRRWLERHHAADRIRRRRIEPVPVLHRT